MLDVLQALTQRATTRRQTADEVLQDAARRTANNERPDLEAVDRALVETGRTPEDFAAMVELTRRRNRWRGDMDKGPAATAARDKAAAMLAKAEAEFVAVRDAWHARSHELTTQVDQAAATVARARDARQALCHPDNVLPPLDERLREAAAAVEEATAEVARITRELRQQSERQANEADWANRKRATNTTTPAGNADDHQRIADRCTRRIAELDQELTDAKKALAQATAHLEAVEAAAIKS